MKNAGKNYHKPFSTISLFFLLSLLLSLDMLFLCKKSSLQDSPHRQKIPLPIRRSRTLKETSPRAGGRSTGQPKAEFAVDESVAHSGKRSIRISSADGADSSFQSIVIVQPYAKYRLSGWIKTRDLKPGTSRGALINLHAMDIMTKAVSGTQDWTRVEVVFDTAGTDAVSVNCLFGGWGKATGTAWFDDVRLELLSARTLKPEAVDRYDKDHGPDLQIHLRPIHRTPRPLHLPGHLGRDARRPQILLSCRRQGIAMEDHRRARAMSG